MPIRYLDGETPRAVFEGHCAPAEADDLLEWLRRTPRPVADLGTCEALHTALAQLLLAARVTLAPPPPDGLLADCLRAAAPPEDAAPPEPTPPAPEPRKPPTARRSRAKARNTAPPELAATQVTP